MDKQENQVLRLIKLIPVLLVFVSFMAILFIVVNNKIQSGKQGIENIRKNYLQRKKSRLKNEVLALVRHIDYEKKIAVKNLKKELKERVQAAYAISMNIYLQNIGKNKKTVVKMIKDALSPIRFNQGRGYFFIYDMDFKNILLPIAPEFEGESFSDYQDVHGNFVVKDMANLCKKHGNTFYSWYWIKPNDKFTSYKKIGYATSFEPFNWFIGTGEYMVDFEKSLQDKILEEIKRMRYGENNYFFTLSDAGVALAHTKESFIGKNYINMKDKNGVFFVKKIIKLAKNGGGFIQYTADINPNTGRLARKISYVANIEKWNWVVGSGEYLDDIEKAIKKRQEELKVELNDTLVRLAVVFILIAILLGVLLFAITKKSKDIFLNYKNTILDETQKSKRQLILIQNQNKLASMGEMLGNISHQWKQPLNTLGISISKMLLLEEDGRLTKEIMLKSFDRMEKNITYLSKTIDVFRDFFKPSRNIETFNLKDEIENVIYIARSSFEHSLIEISYVCEDEIFINGDKKKLEQVLLNILNNAKDAIVSSNIKNGKAKIKVGKFNNKVKITIQDNALGIPAEIKEKVFEPYFTTKEQSEGTGIGLYMSKFIIENNFQGELSFENKNNGTEFIVIIPLN